MITVTESAANKVKQLLEAEGATIKTHESDKVTLPFIVLSVMARYRSKPDGRFKP